MLGALAPAAREALTAAVVVLDHGARHAPANGYGTLVEANILAAIAHRELGDQRATTIATEGALASAEADRLVLSFAMTGALELLEAMPRHETTHAALLADVPDVLRAGWVVADVRGFAEAGRGLGCRPGPRPPRQIAAHSACTQF